MLRGFAVLAVLLQHFVLAAFRFTPHDTFYYFNPGVYGVVVFFCISGFIIPYSVVSLHRTSMGAGGGRSAIRFAVGRFFRLYPVYWLSLASAFLIVPFHGWASLLMNVLMLQRFGGVPDVLGVYWTLQVELIFYGAILILLMTGKVLTVRWYPAITIAFALLSLAMGALRHVYQLHTPLAAFAGVTVMFISTSFFMHLRHGLLGRSTFALLGVAAYAMLCLSFRLGYDRDYGYNEHPSEFYVSYLAAALTFLLFTHFTPSSAPLNFLGRISYPVYLLHTVLSTLVGGLVWRRFGFAWSVAADVSVVMVVCSMVHVFLENPAIAWGKNVVRRMG